MTNQQVIQLIVIVIAVGFSAISWIFKKLQEQAAKKRVRDMQSERELEVLRTGRDPSTGAAPGQAAGESEQQRRQREIAARREAQLAELRRRAAARTSPPPTERPIERIPGTSGPTVPQPVRRAPERTKPRPAPSKPAARAPQQSRRPQVVEIEEPVHRTVPDMPPVSSPVVQVPTPRTAEEWRRAIIASEIMSPPLAARAPGESAPIPF